MNGYQITEWCHRFVAEQVGPGDCCIDATMGNGRDTLFLCRLCGPQGKVYAFDIQPEALERTGELLKREGVLERSRLILDSHAHMDRYVREESVSCIMFNFGYLPGGDHAKGTRKESSLRAVEKSLALLRRGGLLSLCLYSGGDTGFEEKEALLTYLRGLDSRRYLVIRSEYYNRPNHPPVPVLVIKL